MKYGENQGRETFALILAKHAASSVSSVAHQQKPTELLPHAKS
jgi:hypothetical protein